MRHLNPVRPGTIRIRQISASATSAEPQEASDPEPSSDEPAWAHHSQLDPQQLTPILRHYVELKAAHPERVLLYRLGDFFECFFEDAIELSRVLTPGTVLEEGMLSARRNNWLAAVVVVVELAQQVLDQLAA